MGTKTHCTVWHWPSFMNQQLTMLACVIVHNAYCFDLDQSLNFFCKVTNKTFTLRTIDGTKLKAGWFDSVWVTLLSFYDSVQITFIFIGQTRLVFGNCVCTCVTKHSNAFRTFLNWLKNSKRVWHEPKLHISRLPLFENFDLWSVSVWWV